MTLSKPTVGERLLSFLFIDPLIYMYTVVLGTLSLLSSFFDKDGNIQHGFARLWSTLILKTAFCPVTVEGLDRIDTSKSHIYVANHLSALDIPMLYSALPFQFRILAKKELFSYPFMGWHLSRSGQIPLVFEDPRSSLRSLLQASRTAHSGMPLMIFPEGGRSEDGTMKEFKGGAFFVAIKAKVDIVPVVLVGSFEALPMNHYVIQSRPFKLIFGHPISTEGMAPRDMEKLAAQTKAVMEDIYYAHADIPDPRNSATAKDVQAVDQ